MDSVPAQSGPSPVHIDDLSNEQILALSEEDLHRLVRYRMAEEGIKILPRPVQPETEEPPPPDVTVFAVGDFEFTDQVAADAVAEAVNLQAGYRTSTGYDYSIGGYGSVLHILPVRDTEASITRKRAYSPEAWEAHKEQLRAVAEAKRAYREALREYEDAERAAETVRDEVHGRHLEVVATHERRKLLLARFAEYLDLAQGNRQVAMNFLRKAYSPDEDDLAYLYKSLGHRQAVES